MRQGKENEKIRRAAKEAGVYLWEIAYSLGMTDGYFSRKLRFPLSPQEESKILLVIEELKRRKG